MRLYGVTGSDGVALYQAPAGQNGPVVAQFQQDLQDENLWVLETILLDAGTEAALANQALYISVTTPGEPGGAARGQIEPESSTAPPDPSAFLVTATTHPVRQSWTIFPTRFS